MPIDMGQPTSGPSNVDDNGVHGSEDTGANTKNRAQRMYRNKNRESLNALMWTIYQVTGEVPTSQHDANDKARKLIWCVPNESLSVLGNADLAQDAAQSKA